MFCPKVPMSKALGITTHHDHEIALELVYFVGLSPLPKHGLIPGFAGARLVRRCVAKRRRVIVMGPAPGQAVHGPNTCYALCAFSPLLSQLF